MFISVISPIYNSSKFLELFIKKVIENIRDITLNYEIILIDDFSSDNSWQKLKKIKKKYKYLKIKQNKKNIGQHPSIREGLKIAEGDLIFILDCDLQDDPKNFKIFFNSYNKKNETLIGLMSKNSYKKGFVSEFFWILLNFFSKYKFPKNITNFTLISSKQSKRLLKIKKVGFLYGDICKLNIKVKFLSIKRNKRYLGKSSYNFFKVFKLAILWMLIYTFDDSFKINKYEKKN